MGIDFSCGCVFAPAELNKSNADKLCEILDVFDCESTENTENDVDKSKNEKNVL